VKCGDHFAIIIVIILLLCISSKIRQTNFC